jgi:hypothetical protein
VVGSSITRCTDWDWRSLESPAPIVAIKTTATRTATLARAAITKRTIRMLRKLPAGGDRVLGAVCCVERREKLGAEHQREGGGHEQQPDHEGDLRSRGPCLFAGARAAQISLH